MSTTSTSQARHSTGAAEQQAAQDADDAVEQRPLTTADRCDLCQAQAYVRAVMLTGELFFCAHHAREHGERLREVALLFQDESSRLRSRD